MTHRYGQPILLTLAAGQPDAFRWRNADYHIAEVLATWHLRDRWWELSPASPVATTTSAEAETAASDRLYYRVRCVDEQIFDLYYDAACERWVLDRAHD